MNEEVSDSLWMRKLVQNGLRSLVRTPTCFQSPAGRVIDIVLLSPELIGLPVDVAVCDGDHALHPHRPVLVTLPRGHFPRVWPLLRPCDAQGCGGGPHHRPPHGPHVAVGRPQV